MVFGDSFSCNQSQFAYYINVIALRIKLMSHNVNLCFFYNMNSMHPTRKLRSILHSRPRIYHPKVCNNMRYFQCTGIEGVEINTQMSGY